MATEQCPACDDFQGVGDFDPDIGKFYTCRACGHQWSYADENRTPTPAPAEDCCNVAARSGKWGCDECAREWS